MAGEAKQSTMKIRKISSRLSDNLTKAERESLWNLKKNIDLTILTILPEDKGNDTQQCGLQTEDCLPS
jgi:hypothetical protein